jgi:hypothetical protein
LNADRLFLTMIVGNDPVPTSKKNGELRLGNGALRWA